MSAECYVYGIHGGSGLKIGMANHVLARLRELQTGNPVGLGVAFAIPCSSRAIAAHLEDWLHTELVEERRIGEWFSGRRTAWLAAVLSSNGEDRQVALYHSGPLF